jgi:DNA polymerase III alpha subunit
LAQHHPERVGERYRSLNPLLEKATQQDIARGDTMGCFYIESPATRQLLQKTAHGDYETLVAVSSIIRPAANTIAETWVHRHRHMKRPGATPNWQPIHPLVEQALEETHGLMVYQEDVTRVATAAAGFTSDEGNLLRKIMAKKTPATLQLLYQRFCQGCQARGLNAGQIRQVWQMIESFSGYSFCKPHSASYALVSFKAVALKHQHPATFLAAVVANRGGFYSPYAYLSQARRSGITLKPCDINHSQRATQGEDHPPRHLIRLGLDHIKGLHQETLSLILSARQQRPFDSLQEFLQRLNIPRGDVQRLIFSGCFDDLHPKLNRPTLWFQALCFYGAPERGSQLLAMNTPGQPNLPLLPALSLWQRHQQEQELWGFPLSTHPLFFWRPHFPELTRRAIDLVDHAGDTLTLLGVLIAGKITRTRQGEAMGFFTFEDETGLMECVAFPSCYRQCALHLHHLHCFRLKGRVTAHLRTLTLHLDQVEPLQATTPLLASSG